MSGPADPAPEETSMPRAKVLSDTERKSRASARVKAWRQANPDKVAEYNKKQREKRTQSQATG
jgi:hypothetical protein